MATRELRVVATDEGIGSVAFDGHELIFDGAAQSVFQGLRERLGDEVLGANLIDGGWSNGYLYLTDLTDH